MERSDTRNAWTINNLTPPPLRCAPRLLPLPATCSVTLRALLVVVFIAAHCIADARVDTAGLFYSHEEPRPDSFLPEAFDLQPQNDTDTPDPSQVTAFSGGGSLGSLGSFSAPRTQISQLGFGRRMLGLLHGRKAIETGDTAPDVTGTVEM
jgi:hypothetical protein